MSLLRVRRLPALLGGLALAGSLWFGIIQAYVHLHSQVLRAAKVDPRVMDVGMLALNAALLAAFATVQRIRRPRRVDAGEAPG